MKYSKCKDIDRLVSRLIRTGWCYKRGTKHGRLYSPSGKLYITVSTTPGCSRSYPNFRSDVRRILKAAYPDQTIGLHCLSDRPIPNTNNRVS